MTSEDVDDPTAHVEEIHDHLAACLERPVERTASRWIGEAEAVARDLAENDPDESVVEKRLGHVQELLEEVEETGDAAATEHVEQARASTARVLDALD